MLIEQFSYFTFSCFQCPLEDIVKTLSANFLENGKRKLSLKPFMFDLYNNSPLKGGAHFEKAYFFVPAIIEILASCIPTIRMVGILWLVGYLQKYNVIVTIFKSLI